MQQGQNFNKPVYEAQNMLKVKLPPNKKLLSDYKNLARSFLYMSNVSEENTKDLMMVVLKALSNTITYLPEDDIFLSLETDGCHVRAIIVQKAAQIHILLGAVK